MRAILLAAIVLQSVTGSQGPARDIWPQWRGPARTGVLTADQSPSTWPPELKKTWSVEVGEGYSSPASGGGRVFAHARRDPEEVVSAIDLATGTVAWTQKYAAPIEKNPYAKQMVVVEVIRRGKGQYDVEPLRFQSLAVHHRLHQRIERFDGLIVRDVLLRLVGHDEGQAEASCVVHGGLLCRRL